MSSIFASSIHVEHLVSTPQVDLEGHSSIFEYPSMDCLFHINDQYGSPKKLVVKKACWGRGIQLSVHLNIMHTIFILHYCNSTHDYVFAYKNFLCSRYFSDINSVSVDQDVWCVGNVTGGVGEGQYY